MACKCSPRGGGADALFGEPEAEVMTYVGTPRGQGAGSYIQETTYKYVGKGAGDFEPVKVGGRSWLPLIMGVLALLALLLLCLFLTPGATTTTTTAAPFHPPPAPAPVPVPITPPPTPPPTPAPTRAPTPAPTPAPLNECMIGGVNDWSPALRAHCCQVYGNGCPTPAPTPAPEHECSKDLDMFEEAWSEFKKQWCCQHENKGCSKAPQAILFHCEVDVGHLEEDWSQEKKEWCCQHGGHACPDGHGGLTH